MKIKINKKTFIISICSVILIGFIIFIIVLLTKNNSDGDTQAYTSQSSSSVTAETTIQAHKEPSTIKAPNFSVKDVNGNKISNKDMSGVPMVVCFFNTKNQTSADSLAYFQKAYSNYQGNTKFVMIHMVDDVKETADKGTAFIEKNGYTFPLYFDIQNKSKINFEVKRAPSTYFISADGYIEKIVQGKIDYPMLESNIELLHS